MSNSANHFHYFLGLPVLEKRRNFALVKIEEKK